MGDLTDRLQNENDELREKLKKAEGERDSARQAAARERFRADLTGALVAAGARGGEAARQAATIAANEITSKQDGRAELDGIRYNNLDEAAKAWLEQAPHFAGDQTPEPTETSNASQAAPETPRRGSLEWQRNMDRLAEQAQRRPAGKRTKAIPSNRSGHDLSMQELQHLAQDDSLDVVPEHLRDS
jgi:hypothetical protein